MIQKKVKKIKILDTVFFKKQDSSLNLFNKCRLPLYKLNSKYNSNNVIPAKVILFKEQDLLDKINDKIVDHLFTRNKRYDLRLQSNIDKKYKQVKKNNGFYQETPLLYSQMPINNLQLKKFLPRNFENQFLNLEIDLSNYIKAFDYQYNLYINELSNLEQEIVKYKLSF